MTKLYGTSLTKLPSLPVYTVKYTDPDPGEPIIYGSNWIRIWIRNTVYKVCVAEPHSYFADPDPANQVNVDPEPDPSTQ